MKTPAVYDPAARLALARERVRLRLEERDELTRKVGYRGPGTYIAYRRIKRARLELDAAIAECLE